MEKMVLEKFCKELKIRDASMVFSKILNLCGGGFLFESKDVSHIYGRLSLIGVDPVLEIRGKNNEFSITGLNKRGDNYLKLLKDEDFKIADSFKKMPHSIGGEIIKSGSNFEETHRTKRKNISKIIRLVIDKFKQKDKELIGLYGAFSYDFIRLFEDIPNILADEGVDDFRLQLHDTFIFFDHLKEKTEIISYRKDAATAKKDALSLEKCILNSPVKKLSFKITDAKFDLDKKKYNL